MCIFKGLDPALRRSATFDNDTAFARHSLLRQALQLAIFFCDAYVARPAWVESAELYLYEERGPNEPAVNSNFRNAHIAKRLESCHTLAVPSSTCTEPCVQLTYNLVCFAQCANDRAGYYFIALFIEVTHIE